MEENLKLEELISHRDFLLQLVEDQNKRIRSMRLKQRLAETVGEKITLALANKPGVMEALLKQDLQDNKGE